MCGWWSCLCCSQCWSCSLSPDSWRQYKRFSLLSAITLLHSVHELLQEVHVSPASSADTTEGVTRVYLQDVCVNSLNVFTLTRCFLKTSRCSRFVTAGQPLLDLDVFPSSHRTFLYLPAFLCFFSYISSVFVTMTVRSVVLRVGPEAATSQCLVDKMS